MKAYGNEYISILDGDIEKKYPVNFVLNNIRYNSTKQIVDGVKVRFDSDRYFAYRDFGTTCNRCSKIIGYCLLQVEKTTLRIAQHRIKKEKIKDLPTYHFNFFAEDGTPFHKVVQKNLTTTILCNHCYEQQKKDFC